MGEDGGRGGGVPVPGARGSPGRDPLRPGGPTLPTPTLGRAGRGFLCPFSDRERSLCGFSPWVFCPKWIPGTPLGCPDPSPQRATVHLRHSLRALNKFALSPEQGCVHLLPQQMAHNPWLNMTDSPRGRGQSAWTGIPRGLGCVPRGRRRTRLSAFDLLEVPACLGGGPQPHLHSRVQFGEHRPQRGPLAQQAPGPRGHRGPGSERPFPRVRASPPCRPEQPSGRPEPLSWPGRYLPSGGRPSRQAVIKCLEARPVHCPEPLCPSQEPLLNRPGTAPGTWPVRHAQPRSPRR